MAHLEIRADDPIWKQIGFNEAAISSVTRSIDDHWHAMVAVSTTMGEPALLDDVSGYFQKVNLIDAVKVNFAYLILHKLDQFGISCLLDEDGPNADDVGFVRISQEVSLGWLIKLRNYCRDTPDPGSWTHQGYAHYQSPQV